MPIYIDKKFKRSKFDARDRLAKLPVLDNLPSAVDLKPWADEVEDQLHLGSCTANAGCSSLELAYLRAGIRKDFSRLYLYWWTRYLGNIVGDEGAYPRDICRALYNYGVCLESTWDYIPSKVNTKPSDPSMLEAVDYKATAYERIQGTQLEVNTQIKNALARGIPVLTSIWLHESFMHLTGPWQTHHWDTIDSETNPMVGGHEVLIIGYDDNSQKFLAENSWGSDWADGGFFGIPYSYTNGVVDEWWILTEIPVPYIPVAENIEPIVPPTPPKPTDNPVANVFYIGVAVGLVALIALILLTT